MMSFSLIFIAMLAGQGGSPELVDLIPASEYWQIKEVEAGTENLIKLANTPGEDAAGEVQRLMAIRSLGEFGVADAEDTLADLRDKSDDRAVVRQAAIALARIRNEPAKLRAVDLTEALAGDVAALPGGINAVGQYRMTPTGQTSASIDDALAEMAPMLGQMGGGDPDVDQIRQQIAASLVPVADQIGNARFDAVTFGVVGNPGDDGVVVIIGRGHYHRDRLVKFLTPMADGSSEVGGRPVLRFTDTAMVFDSDERVVMIAGEMEDQLPVERVVAALDGEVEQPGEAIAALIKAVDKSGPMWGVVQMIDSYRENAEPPLSQMKHLTVSSQQDNAEGVPKLAVTVRAEADSADAMAEAAKVVKAGVDEGLAEMKRAKEGDRAPAVMIDPMIELLSTVKVETDGAAGTMTATWKGGAMMPLLTPMM